MKKGPGGGPFLRIETDKPRALDSPDHIKPWGTARDNSFSLAFNRKLLWWMPPFQLRVLDLGCAGGGFVKSILDQGGFAVGVEGSDYSKLRKRAEWPTIPDHLFTADITVPFRILKVDENGQEHPIDFNLITAWEVMEHIRKDQLHGVAQNVLDHLAPQGLVIMSISPNEEIIDGVNLHQTVENRDWWVSKFVEFGFAHHESVLTYFGSDWVRGGDNAPGSFHLAMTRSSESLPRQDALKLLMPLIRIWNETRRVEAMLMNKSIRILSVIIPSPAKRIYRRFSTWRSRT